jgi:outer membrane protein assembly factor BamB
MPRRRIVVTLALTIAPVLLLITGCGGAVPTSTPSVESTTAAMPTAAPASALPASSAAWPMLGRDAARSGRSPYPAPIANRLAWSARLSDFFRKGCVIGKGGTLYVPDERKDRLLAVSPQGEVRWVFKARDAIEAVPAVGPDGTIYFGCWDYKLYALSPEGKLKWTYKTGDSIQAAPAVGSDGTIYVVSDEGDYDDMHGVLYAIAPGGKLRWKFRLHGDEGLDPAVGPSGAVYVSDGDWLYAVTPQGRQKWVFKARILMTPAVDASGTAYVGSQDDKFYAIGADGKLKWSYKAPDALWYATPAIGADGTVYAGVMGKGLFAFAPDGSVKWRFIIPDLEGSSPAIGQDGTIYIGSGASLMGRAPKGPQGHFYVLSPDGNLKWSYSIQGIVDSAPAIDASGTVYIASWDGSLYAFSGAN